ncbi:MAG: hypothetical protein AB8I08_22140 [Sandaracinaceae bacterium]
MALRALLDRGIGSILEGGDAELESLARRAGLESGAEEHLLQTLQALPGLVEQIHGALRGKEVPASARNIFLGVMRYLFLEEDLIPSRAGTTLLGLMDDTYLVHRAAQELRDQLYPVDMRSVDGGAQLLRQLLPEEVVTQLDGIVEAARAE